MASQKNFKDDHITKENTTQLQYYFQAENSLKLRRARIASRTIESGVIYKEISDSIFVLKENTPGVLKYIYRDSLGKDNMYVSFHQGMHPIPFWANNNEKEFRIRVEGKILMTSGAWEPALFLKNEDGEIQEIWVVEQLDKSNRLAYQVGTKNKQVVIRATGEKIED
ncbi:MAG: hypothetical protein ACK4FA_00210 [Candidatus Paceibacteria bacterium]